MFEEARRDVWTHARKMWEAGLVTGSAGNVSRRAGEGHIAITPTSVAYDVLSPEQIVIVELESGRAVETSVAPSYELPMHLVVYRRRPDISAIVHTHAPFVTTLSVLRRPLPPVIDEMIVLFGGTIPVTGYALTGTADVGENVVNALGDGGAVILASHGNVCVAGDLPRALHLAMAMEAGARVYVQALAIGQPVELKTAR
ncbi:MAG TPA: class II aldolase/adducin family protein [Thermoanaerobaculia bacterium]|nr:class II aldolase/adducin family protein [Thermoanaerobaculia bacterium]